MQQDFINPDYLFEVSWEVCNKVGGIYTVAATKSLFLRSRLKRHHILIGPDFSENKENRDFIEDFELYKAWKNEACKYGLHLRIGRWNVPGHPVAVLIDFQHFAPSQDEFMTRLWMEYGVDSITGTGDYKDSFLFGYVSGMVIESFYKYYLDSSDKVVAQFHEWQTGAGVLYIKSEQLPVATVFTTHATVIGRCIAGNNLSLYDDMNSYNADEIAVRFNVRARHSLEKKSACNADIFTTVSGITAVECENFLGRKVDMVTPNGFENSFTPRTESEYAEKRKIAREKLLSTARAMSCESFDKDSILIGIGGRYEFRNKGIDVFIDSLALLNKSYSGKTINAFIMIPAGHEGPDKQLRDKLNYCGNPEYSTNVTHRMSNPEYDTITRKLAECGLVNKKNSKIKVYFIPSYLNGNDGIFDMPYYDLLIGLDLAVFPSYYEPWGYTPLEALAFRIPTLTTNLSGFGVWVEEHYPSHHPGITVLKRTDNNYHQIVEGVADRILEISSLNDEEREQYMKNAADVASVALWDNQIKYYLEAYSRGIEKIKVVGFSKLLDNKKMAYKKNDVNSPSWKSVMVTRKLPEVLSGLEVLSKNLWWCWNEKAKALFKTIDPVIWHDSCHNPMAVLDSVSLKKFKELANDKEFLHQLDCVMQEFNEYMSLKSERKDPSIAYFCMEYGLDTSLKIYSGGLGILAGDYIKETSDMNVNLVAVGFLYRYGYFTQVISASGDQIANYDAQDFMRLPIQPATDKAGNWITVSLEFPGRNITARIWKVEVGRTDLYLLDTDYEANIPEDRQVTYQLYGGDWENRLKQELLLGLGGIRALRKLGLNPKIYHCNEGHAAFVGLERLREYVEKENLTFSEAMEVVRASSLFTTHTPVPAGHDAFEPGMLRKYLSDYPAFLKVDWNTLMSLGKMNPEDEHEKFSMSTLAANISQEVNGVSMLHGKVSRDIFSYMYPGYLPEELFISHVTNGVHYPTWTAYEWKQIHARVFGEAFKTHHYDKSCFEGIYKVKDEEIWNTRKKLKSVLIKVINEKISDPQTGGHYSPSQIVKIKETLRDDVLTIGFARRFATYKRATLLFSDLDKLDSIINNPERPVQFIFAGKAHPADKAGQDLIKRIVEISKQDRFIGKIVFVPGYDINLAKRLVQGVDVWMNNPTRPQEASGTSGEKASMNGVMHFSVLDGWWVEGYLPGAGWALPQERVYDEQGYQNELDSATIYATIENEIAPMYYDTDSATGLSSEWIACVKNTIAKVASNFTTNRMLSDYLRQYYEPQAARFDKIASDDYKEAKEISRWKQHVEREWQNVEVISYTRPESSYTLAKENDLNVEVVLNLANLLPEDIGVEILFAITDKKNRLHIQDKCEFTLAEFKDGVAKYQASILPQRTGMYQMATRIYAKNGRLPHRQDMGLVRWL